MILKLVLANRVTTPNKHYELIQILPINEQNIMYHNSVVIIYVVNGNMHEKIYETRKLRLGSRNILFLKKTKEGIVDVSKSNYVIELLMMRR